MRNKWIMAAVAAALSASAVGAQDRDYRRDDGTYNNGDRHVYNTRDRRYQDCRRSKGTTGTIAGAVGGGLIGNAVGGGTLGTLAGAGGGALLGRHIDQKHDAAQNRKNGC